MTSTTDDASCPVCDREYDDRIVVERGDRWGDLVGTPFSFFKNYQRRCSARYDVEDDVTVGNGEYVVYLHEGRRRADLL